MLTLIDYRYFCRVGNDGTIYDCRQQWFQDNKGKVSYSYDSKGR